MEKSRRAFLKALALGAGALMVAPIIQIQKAAAALVKDTDPMVKALGYVANVDALKGAAVPAGHKKGNKCGNCQFYADPTGKAPEAKCQLIQGGDVQSTGWCRSYSARAGAGKKA